LSWYGGLVEGKGELLPGFPADAEYHLTKWPQTEREFPRHFRIATATACAAADGPLSTIPAAGRRSHALPRHVHGRTMAGLPPHRPAAPRAGRASDRSMIDPERYPRLSRIDSPADLRGFGEDELPAIAGELRDYLIESVGRSGGHFGAGLGVVELTVALHWLYDTPQDRIVWDVGHQTYPHKILTGRRDRIHTVKQAGGIAPFPKRDESEYDTFGVGHSSTSISAALGMAIANARAGNERRVVAVIGDGAMTAGMAYEALNHAGGMEPEPDILVVLNDNRMSISENVGGMTRMLGRMTGSRTLNALREGGKKLLGDKHGAPARFVRRWEEHWKGMFVPSTLFEEMGFHYTGPIDGHDVARWSLTLRTLRTLKGPQLLHVITTKGKGYERAEGDQIGYHAVGPFDPRPAWSASRVPGRRNRPTPTCSPTGCATWPRPNPRSWASPRRCAKARAWCASRRNSPSATSTSRSPSSTRSRSPPAWPARAPSRCSRSTRPSCSAATTSWCTTWRSRTSTCCSRSTAAAWSDPTAPPTPATST
jgi:transketolase N-terminal domain/subunit